MFIVFIVKESVRTKLPDEAEMQLVLQHGLLCDLWGKVPKLRLRPASPVPARQKSGGVCQGIRRFWWDEPKKSLSRPVVRYIYYITL